MKDGLPIVLVVGERTVDLLAGEESLGSYPIWEVEAERIAEDRFRLTVAGDELVFEADDAIAFSYEGVPFLTKAKAPLVSDRVRRWFSSRPEGSVIDDLDNLEERHHHDQDVEPNPPATVTRLIPQNPEPVADEGGDVLDPAAEIAAGESMVAVRSIREALSKPPAACPGLRADGELCGVLELGPRGFCDVHDPDRIAERRVSKERLEAAISEVESFEGTSRFVDVVARLEKALTEVHEGTLDVDRAGAMADLVQAMVSAHDRSYDGPRSV